MGCYCVIGCLCLRFILTLSFPKTRRDTRKVCPRLSRHVEGNDQITQNPTKTSHPNTPHEGVSTYLFLRFFKIGRFVYIRNKCKYELLMSLCYCLKSCLFRNQSFLFRGTKIVQSKNKSNTQARLSFCQPTVLSSNPP